MRSLVMFFGLTYLVSWTLFVAASAPDPTSLFSNQRRETTRTLRIVGAIAAILSVVGLAILVFWFIVRAPRF